MMKTILFLFMIATVYPGKRQVLLFYNQNGKAICDQQVAVLQEDKQGLLERDIIIHVYNATEEKETASRWKVKPMAPFTFLLIGKDGGEKMRADTVVSKEQLFSMIDAMPMRKEEMKHRK